MTRDGEEEALLLQEEEEEHKLGIMDESGMVLYGQNHPGRASCCRLPRFPSFLRPLPVCYLPVINWLISAVTLNVIPGLTLYAQQIHVNMPVGADEPDAPP